MVVDVYVEFWFDSGLHGNLIMNIHLWKVQNICKGCGIEINIEWEQVQCWSLCVILTDTVDVDSYGGVCIPDVINKLTITNAANGRPGIKEYPTDGN